MSLKITTTKQIDKETKNDAKYDGVALTESHLNHWANWSSNTKYIEESISACFPLILLRLADLSQTMMKVEGFLAALINIMQLSTELGCKSIWQNN